MSDGSQRARYRRGGGNGMDQREAAEWAGIDLDEAERIDAEPNATPARHLNQSHGSQQLRTFRAAMANGNSVEVAAHWSGMNLVEAKLTAAEDANNPPPAEALQSLPGRTFPWESTAPAGDAPLQAPGGDKTMARAQKQDDGVENDGGGEIKPMDVDLVLKLIRTDIRPAQAKVGDHAQEMSTAYKAVKKQGNMNPQAVRLAVRLDDMEDAAREHWLRSFRAILSGLNIFIPRDLVDVAEGVPDSAMSAVPVAEREPAALHTLAAE